MTESIPTIQADFDRIAPVSQDEWDHNVHYYAFLLKHIRLSCEVALDVGCGTGAFSRLLTERSDHVVAPDLSPRMIEIARKRSRSHSNVEYRVAESTSGTFPAGEFDCVASIATLHHLPVQETLLKMKRSLRAGGTLAILDLYQPTGLRDVLVRVIAGAVNPALRFIKTGRLREPRQVSEAWAEHRRNGAYAALARVRQVCERVLPGAEVRKNLLWRYSIIWTKAA